MLAVINTPQKDKPVALREVEEPTPAPNEALVQVAAFSLNRGELAQLNRLEYGWRPGQDVAGTVLRQASDGSGPPPGTRIVGLTEEAGWAERTPVRTDRLAVLSDNTRFEEAAAHNANADTRSGRTESNHEADPDTRIRLNHGQHLHLFHLCSFLLRDSCC